jgi:hypothetical protein
MCSESRDIGVMVAATDSVGRPYSPFIDKNSISAVLSANGIEHQVGISTGEIESFGPDWIFVSRPFDDYAEPHLVSSELSRFGRLAHLSYGSNLLNWSGDYAFLNSNPWMANASAYFVNSRFEHGGTQKFVPVGQFKLDEYSYFGRPVTTSPKPTIAWKPRWTATSESSLANFLDTFVDLALSGNWEVRFVMHPMLGTALDGTGQYELAERLRKFLSLSSVVIVDGPDFLDDLLGSDVFVADTTSGLAEFLWTGRPLIWTRPPEAALNELGHQILANSYGVFEPSELPPLLERVVLQGLDPYSTRRDSAFGELFGISGEPAACRVLSYIRSSG